MPKKLVMGNEAFAWAALEAGVNVVAGYPGTPSSEVVETVAKLHAQGVAKGVHVEWSTNEKAALEMLYGASISGARCLFTCKQMGLNVASDALMSLNYVGVRGGLVLLVCDDPGPISSQTEQDTRRFASFAKVPVFDPATPEQGYAMIQEAFEVSERYGTPVIVRPTTRVDHASTFFELPETTEARPLPEDGFVRDDKWIIFPRRAYQAHGEIKERLSQIAVDSSKGTFNPTAQVGENPTVGIVCGGVSTQYVREALAILAETADLPAYRFLQVGTPYPFPQEAALRFADGLERIIVFEELDHVLEDEFIKLAGLQHLSYNVSGKLDDSTQFRGENTTESACSELAAFFGIEWAGVQTAVSAASAEDQAASIEPPVRPPMLCPSCPHRGAFYAVKQAVGKRSHIFCGDIGCYTLGNAKPLEAVETCLCMGAGITMAQGAAVADPDRVCVAFVGDSTFFASGMTGIANAVYNQHNICVCVLDNSTTAMTGKQPHPGTGVTLMGPESEPIDTEAVLTALGVKCIEHANPLYLEESQAAVQRAIDFDGPAAVIFQSPCIQLVKPEPAAVVDADTCIGCRLCITRLGCPAMALTPEGKMEVDAASCFGCGLCVDVCPTNAISCAVRDENRVPYAKEASHA